jgi:hypothetical protein
VFTLEITFDKSGMNRNERRSRARNEREDVTRPLSPSSLDGLEPRPMDWAAGTCGIYLLCDGNGTGVAVFKPQDEEKIPEHAK